MMILFKVQPFPYLPVSTGFDKEYLRESLNQEPEWKSTTIIDSIT